jgi:hypothetical protein
LRGIKKSDLHFEKLFAFLYLQPLKKVLLRNAGVAQLVERHLAKVEVAGSSLVSRSKRFEQSNLFLLVHLLPTGRGGGTGRHAGLKILFALKRVRVRFPPAVHKQTKASAFAEAFVFIPIAARLY